MNSTTFWLDLDLLNNPVRLWVSAVGLFAASMLLIGLVRSLLRRRLRKAGATPTEVDDVLLGVVDRTKVFLLALPIAHLSLAPLTLPPKLIVALRFLAVIGFMLQVGLWASALAEFWMTRHKREKGSDPVALTTLSALSFVLKVVVWIIVGVLTLDNLGFDVTALVAGLGIGGIAIALATQNILGDLFASLSIIVDKPFVIGDFITAGQDAGRVEKIGMKTTRIRSLTGELLVFSNSDLLQSRIHNYRPMLERRVLLQFGVTYQTPPEKLAGIPQLVRGIIERQDRVRFDRGHFVGFGDSSLNFEFVYFTLSPEYIVFSDIRQAVGLEVVSVFAAEEIEFAYPTRTLFMVPPEPEKESFTPH